MAYNPVKISPLDIQARKGVGVKIPFESNGVFVTTYSTQETIKSNIINLFLTGRGERYLNPSFGTGIRSLLFSQITSETAFSLDQIVREAISRNMPRVVVQDVQNYLNPDSNSISLYIKYKVSETNIEDEVFIKTE